MEEWKIDKILKRNQTTSHHYLGCFAADELLQINPLKYPYSMVVNFDNSEYEGSHWVAIFSNSPFEIEYYDSLGIWPPLNPNITEYLSRFPRVYFNRYAYQAPHSKVCGKHAIFFLFNRSSGKTFNEILLFLTKFKVSPDRIVSNFVSNKIFSEKANYPSSFTHKYTKNACRFRSISN